MSSLSAPTAPQPAEPAIPTPGQEVPSFGVTPGRLRFWGIRSALSLLDQILTSAASFGVNVVLARWMPLDVYGAFAVSFATFLFLSGFYNALLLEPLSVIGPSRYPERLPAYFRGQLAVHALLVGGLSVVILFLAAVLWLINPLSPMPGAIAGGGLALPFLLLLWGARRMCYVAQKVKTAVVGSSFYFLFVLAGLLALRYVGLLSPFFAFCITALGSLLASLMLLRVLGVPWRKDKDGGPFRWRHACSENWNYGRWAVGSTLLNSFSTQVQTVLVAGYVGLGAAGVLRAMQLPMLAMVNALGAAGSLVLPLFSRDFGLGKIHQLRQKARLVSLVLGGGELCFVGLLALLAVPLERLLFGGKYASYAWMMPVLSAIPLFVAVSMGFAHSMRAAHKPHFDFLANAVAAPVAMLSSLLFIKKWGAGGAAASMVLASLVYMVCVMFIYYGQPKPAEQQGRDH